MAHSKLFSPSASERWLNCHASIDLVSRYENTSSAYADEGSCAHHVAELALEPLLIDVELGLDPIDAFNPDEYIGKTFYNTVVDEDMCQYVQQYVDYVYSLMMCESHQHAELAIEVKTHFTQWLHPDVPSDLRDGSGTVDARVIIYELDEASGQWVPIKVKIADLKYGKGVPVEVEGNTQLLIYGEASVEEAGAYFETPSVDIELECHVVQPRLGVFKGWTPTLDDRAAIRAKVYDASKSVVDKSAEYLPTEKGCMWCPHKPNCKAYEGFIGSMLNVDFDELVASEGDFDILSEDDNKPEVISDERAYHLLKAEKMLTSWLSAIRKVKQQALFDGHESDYFKLVNGRSSRNWIEPDDEKNIKKICRKTGLKKKDVIETSVLSPAKLEKKLGKKTYKEQVASLVNKKPGGLVLALEDDPRKSPVEPATSLFDNLDEEDDILG